MVAAGLVQQSNGGPGAHRDESYARIDDVQIGYRQGDSEIIDALELPEARNEPSATGSACEASP